MECGVDRQNQSQKCGIDLNAGNMAAAKNITNNTINLNLLPLCPECNMDLNDGNIPLLTLLIVICLFNYHQCWNVEL